MADVLTLASDPTTRRAQVLAHRRSPAHHLHEEMTAGSGDAVALREVPFLTQVALRAEPGTPGGDAVEAALGAALPRRVGEVTAGAGGLAVLWLAPDEFLAVAPDEAESGVLTTEYAGRLAAALGERPGQVVDLSANRTTLELSGPAARSVLDKGCRLDLHPRVFPVGAAVATQLGATPVILWRTAEQTWRVLVRASFATHTVRWLLDGMREYA
ncbi:sarcosine oxidase subunit gamma [Georgenia thermotolerans]|uniref:Sarcosine oxidase subunit gamma family protein n=1 Tax=Georgenia thermotolerans TaxID=527326 RepID=A0A7J5UQC9_9MICO|nr:sarcosine oxidase subunit gamma family protein [Georgenia thermotolerans]KAE8764163.1 sarcosine oxidase subunit gamma family protein [Georgenia thermotolerans]